MKKYIYCDLYYLMIRNGIKSVSELQRITKLPRRTLDKCINNDSVQIHHNTALVLCEALDCTLSELYRIVDEVEYKELMNGTYFRKDYLRSGCVYFVKDQSTGMVKIGKTSDLGERIKQLRWQYGQDLELIHSVESEDSVSLEKQIHRHYDKCRVEGEWFFLTSEDLREIKNA